MVASNGYMFSLATHGGIRAWSVAAPGPIDQIIRPELAKQELMYTRQENFKISVGTWNVSQGKPSQDALTAWLGAASSDVGILVVGLQEVEMGAGFLAMSAAKESVGLEGSSIGHWWQDAIGKVLGEGTAFERVGSRQLAALLIAICWCISGCSRASWYKCMHTILELRLVTCPGQVRSGQFEDKLG